MSWEDTICYYNECCNKREAPVVRIFLATTLIRSGNKWMQYDFGNLNNNWVFVGPQLPAPSTIWCYGRLLPTCKSSVGGLRAYTLCKRVEGVSESIIRNVCRNEKHGCYVSLRKCIGFNGRLCILDNNYSGLLYNAGRIRYTLKRTGCVSYTRALSEGIMIAIQIFASTAGSKVSSIE